MAKKGIERSFQARKALLRITSA